ncbi:hypothetical protein JMN21_00375 [Pseudomonas syringae pv. actinidiae]|jgi:hypothetical protein|uniref:hypothetical protein n=1 Tax=Pseudomonas syringae TaxID=317 RepID=UPI000A1E992A|nr:hypothetical protein [Pseudomonas syringae]MBL3605716.1 hypothetical protein [Pseudomonas syringae pv. actinidiae]MBL3635042.1 hypothetical protein [Pseudomonas syringae pv. actinidiae]MBL3659185.1 hypothetical protein [Pseudomonas syringae pv. actinidiae]MDU8583765.1 hypothetical protein [Pseudomonas syringae pv. actinidiae]OSN23766.1 hypothetical protein BV339_01036 [Pseudomonas syringae pv. actinidiae]
MPQTQHPSDFEPKLTPEYLGIVCHNVLEAAYLALAAASTEDDTNWTVGTLLYGRVHGRFKTMHRDKSMQWFQLANSTMDYTPSVNGVLMQVVMDDPNVRKKAHRMVASRVELYQASLLGPSNDSNLTWRLYVDSDGNMEDPKLTVTVLGLDTNLNVVCQWMHDYTPLQSVRTIDLPEEVDIPEQFPIRRDKDADRNVPIDADQIDE